MTDSSPASQMLHFGAAYYPEHWPEDRVDQDIPLMLDAGFTVVRMGEFAWSTFEPARGKFNLDWMEKAILKLAVNGIKTVLGTPTAAPPAWLITEHPDILPIDENGRKVQFGNRVHYCVNSPEYHQATARIVGALAERFGPNQHVIGWQIDNEFGRVCYCDTCRKRFQDYLARKYGTLDELNRRWTTAYWSQTYSAWQQIPIPIGPHHPSLMLEWKRFVTQSYREFQKLQIDLIRPHLAPEVWITHNFMGWFDGLDHYDMAADLDLVSWDWYVGSGHNDPYFTNSTHDLTRGFKRKNFWVMETQPGTVNWSKVNNPLYKGEARTMAFQAIGRGADGILYWQWRSALGGQEQMHGTLIDQSGQPRPFYEEAAKIGADIKKVSTLLAGSTIRSRAAVINDYESRWAIQWQKHHKDFDYVAHLQHYYRPLAMSNIPVDIVSPDLPLKEYKLVIAPALLLMDENRFANLKEFVEAGGYLILTPRCAMKNRDNVLFSERQPSTLTSLAGVEVNEYYAMNEDVPVKGNWFDGVSRTWAEVLKVVDTSNTLMVAKYEGNNELLSGQPAITVKAAKTGMFYYCGAYLDDASQSAFINRVAQVAGISKLLEAPAGVTVSRRLKGSQEILIVVNHTNQEKTVNLGSNTYDDHIKGSRLAGMLRLPSYG
ncbi:MAG: beta-galactosidase, partial [Anaerolineae bacterium]|nr:beta-galactosidase [Anaerolineae bacterium]